MQNSPLCTAVAQFLTNKAHAHSGGSRATAATSQLPDAREWTQAFLEKRKPNWNRGRP